MHRAVPTAGLERTIVKRREHGVNKLSITAVRAETPALGEAWYLHVKTPASTIPMLITLAQRIPALVGHRQESPAAEVANPDPTTERQKMNSHRKPFRVTARAKDHLD